MTTAADEIYAILDSIKEKQPMSQIAKPFESPNSTTVHVNCRDQHMVHLITRIATYSQGWSKFHQYNQQLEIRFPSIDSACRFIDAFNAALVAEIEIRDESSGYSGSRSLGSHNKPLY